MANKIRNIAPPNLPVAPVEYERRYQDQFANVLRLFFNLVANAINAPKPHGSFYDTTTQTNPVASAVNLMKVNSIYDDAETAFSVSKDTNRIYVAETAVYNIQFSAQLDKISGGTAFIFIWLRVNGVNVPNSASQIRIQGNNAEIVAAWNYLHEFNVGDYFEIMWSTDDTSCQILAAAASTPVPGIPSVILTVTNNI